MKQALIAVGVFAVLLGVVLATRDHGNVNVGVARLELPVVEMAAVTSIELGGAQTVTLKKEGAGWTVADASKVFHAADEGQVNAVLEGLKDLKTELFVTEKSDRFAELEIDEGKGLSFKVFTTGTAPALDVVFGKQGKSGGAYLRSAKSQQVFLTNSRLAIDARHQALRWRKRQIFPAHLPELTRVTAQLDDGAALAIEAQPDGSWVLGAQTPAPAGFRYDPAAAQRFASTLTGAWAVDFLDGASDALFPQPHTVITATLKDGKTATLHLGAAVPAATDRGQPSAAGVAAKVDGNPEVYVLSNDQAAQLRKHVTDLRDTSLLAFDVGKAQKLAINAAGKKTVVGKEGGAWKLLQPKAMPAGSEFESAQVDRVLARLVSMRAEALVDVAAATAGLNKPTATVEVFLEGGGSKLLKFGADAGGQSVYVQGTVDPLVYKIDKGNRAQFETALELFKKPPPRPQNMGNMRGLENLPPEIRQQLEAQLRAQQH